MSEKLYQSVPVEQVWAEESGTMVRFERLPNGLVSISILGIDPTVELASATLGAWRWERAVNKLSAAAPPAVHAPLPDENGCPCLLIEPCSSNCSCAHPVRSGGCQRCAKYGSTEQRIAKSHAIAAKLKPAVHAPDDPIITAQHDETGRMWTGPRSALPRRFFEVIPPPGSDAVHAPETALVERLENEIRNWKLLEVRKQPPIVILLQDVATALAARDEQIAALQTEVAGLRLWFKSASEGADESAKTVEALRADALRYRWLRDFLDPKDYYSKWPRWTVARETGGMGQLLRGEKLDIEVDAALKDRS